MILLVLVLHLLVSILFSYLLHSVKYTIYYLHFIDAKITVSPKDETFTCVVLLH